MGSEMRRRRRPTARLYHHFEFMKWKYKQDIVTGILHGTMRYPRSYYILPHHSSSPLFIQCSDGRSMKSRGNSLLENVVAFWIIQELQALATTRIGYCCKVKYFWPTYSAHFYARSTEHPRSMQHAQHITWRMQTQFCQPRNKREASDQIN